MLINVFRFYQFESIYTHKVGNAQVFDIEVTSKRTGEVFIFSFIEEEFDDLLEEMENSLYGMQVLLEMIREQGAVN